MTLPIWLAKPSQADGAEARSCEVDLAIVGGGVMGAACAYFAAQEGSGGSARVLLIDAAQPAHGASGRNAGFVLRGIHTYYDSCVKQYGRDLARYVYGLGEENQALLRHFMDSHGSPADFDYDPCGSYLLASSLDEFDSLARSAQLMREDGFELELIKEDPLDRGFYGALHNPGDFGLNPVKLVRALIEAADVDVISEEAVRRIETNGAGGHRISLITTNRTVHCQRVILATNAYSPLLDDYFIDLVKPVRGQMLATQPLKKRLLDKLCYANFGWEYFRQLPDRRLLVGGCRQHFVEAEEGYGDLITRPVQQALEHYLRDHFPELAGVAVDYRWSGVMAFTADGLPLLGELPDHPGVYFVTGCNGHGLGYSMVLSRQAVEMAMNVGNCAASPAQFSVNRSALRALSGAAKVRDRQNRQSAEREIGP